MNPKLALVPLALSLSACDARCSPDSGRSSSPTPMPSAPTANASPTKTEGSSPAVPASSAQPSRPASGALVAATNAFCTDLWGAIRDTQGNLAISPASLVTALAMTLGGARGDTASEMKRALHVAGSTDDFIASTGELVRTWNAGQGPTVLRVANKLFGEKTYAFEQPYVDKTGQIFGAPLEPVDFVKAAESARKLINGWVAKETQDRIKDLIPANGVDDQTRLALVNAIYFKAEWEDPFQIASTRPAPFSVSATDKKDVPTMNRTGYLRFGVQDGVKLLELPYKSGDASMVIVLPDAVDGLGGVEKAMTPKAIDRWMKDLKFERVSVALPRFEIDPPSSIELRTALGKLGVKTAFDRDKADFRDIGNPPNPADRLVISKVFHKAFVKLDEKGTEAAGGTAVVMARAGSAPPKDPPKEFKADHPFLFFLRDTRSGLILFMGRVADPSVK